MSDAEPESTRRTLWRIPGWYRRVGLASWFFLGIAAAVNLLAVIIAATSELVAPLVLGAFLAVVYYPLADWLEAHRFPRGLAALTVLLGLIVVIVGVSYITGVALVDQSDELTTNLNATGGAADRAISLIDAAFAIVTGAILGTIVFYYLLKDGQQLFAKWLDREQDDERRALFERIGERTVANTQSYFKGRTAMAVMNGAAIGLAAWVLGVPAAGAIAVVNFLGAYIPYLGAFIGGAFAVLMALGEGGIGLALIVLGIALAVNLLLENLLEPVLLGGSLNLHPLLILLVTSLGGIIAGMIGLILAAPALAIAIDIERELKASGFFDDD